jgi:hypothetical protein
MPQIGASRDLGWKVVVAVLAVAGTFVFVGLATAGILPTTVGPSQWTERTVTASVSRSCYFVNSSANVDRFCLQLLITPGGESLNGTFDHLQGTPVFDFVLSQGLACAQNPSSCPPGWTWTSPDGTGQVYWTLSGSVTLRALNGPF